MDQQKQQIIEKVNAANNVLVTVSTNPSVDQLAACIGLTLLLNKMGKHATAVFSGKVPSTIEFLKPEQTLEQNTDSLRDFIIAIDKNKADKLRYKVEDEIVKIFITPYKHSINEEDLVYSQGDFNVDVVLALGVARQQDIDGAIMAHGRILHDAVVITLNIGEPGDLGTVNWLDKTASGVAELSASLAVDMARDLLDKQIATALLTGIVAATDHFGNARTTPQTMTVSAALLAAGANQQLVATQLGHLPDSKQPQTPKQGSSGSAQGNSPLKIAHTNQNKSGKRPDSDAPSDEPAEVNLEAILKQTDDQPPAGPTISLPEPVTSPLEDMPPFEPTPSEPRDTADTPDSSGAAGGNLPLLPSAPDVSDDETLSEIEAAVHSPHLDAVSGGPVSPPASESPASTETSAAEEVDSARKAVEDALKTTSAGEPPVSLNAIPVDLDLGHDTPPEVAPPPVSAAPAAPAPPLSPFGADASTQFAPPMSPVSPPPPLVPPLPPNPAINEQAPLSNSPADQPVTMPLPQGLMGPPGGLQVPPPAMAPPTSTGLPPQGPPPPPAPPPIVPHGF